MGSYRFETHLQLLRSADRLVKPGQRYVIPVHYHYVCRKGEWFICTNHASQPLAVEIEIVGLSVNEINFVPGEREPVVQTLSSPEAALFSYSLSFPSYKLVTNVVELGQDCPEFDAKPEGFDVVGDHRRHVSDELIKEVQVATYHCTYTLNSESFRRFATELVEGCIIRFNQSRCVRSGGGWQRRLFPVFFGACECHSNSGCMPLWPHISGRRRVGNSFVNWLDIVKEANRRRHESRLQGMVAAAGHWCDNRHSALFWLPTSLMKLVLQFVSD